MLVSNADTSLFRVESVSLEGTVAIDSLRRKMVKSCCWTFSSVARSAA